MLKVSEETVQKWLKDGISKERAQHISRELSKYTERDYLREMNLENKMLERLENKNGS